MADLTCTGHGLSCTHTQVDCFPHVDLAWTGYEETVTLMCMIVSE